MIKQLARKIFLKFLNYIQYYPEIDDFKMGEALGLPEDKIGGATINTSYAKYKNGYVKVYIQTPILTPEMEKKFRKNAEKYIATIYPDTEKIKLHGVETKKQRKFVTSN